MVFDRTPVCTHSLPGRRLPFKAYVHLRLSCDQCDHSSTRDAYWRHWARQHSCLSHSRLRQLLRQSKYPIACDICLETTHRRSIDFSEFFF
jgi:hypothetical protein